MSGGLRRRGSGGYWETPAQPWHRSPLLALGLLEPPGEVIDAHVLELEQMFQTLHLHLKDLYCLLRGQQLLLLFSDLEDEVRIPLQRLVIPRGSGSQRMALSAVGSSLAEALASDLIFPF